MKNKFERLGKKERKEAIKEYTNSSDHNASVMSRIKRLRVVGIIGAIYSLVMFVFDFLKERGTFDYGLSVFDNILLNYLIDGCLLIFCAIFIIKSNLLIKEQVNKYLIEKKK